MIDVVIRCQNCDSKGWVIEFLLVNEETGLHWPHAVACPNCVGLGLELVEADEVAA